MKSSLSEGIVGPKGSTLLPEAIGMRVYEATLFCLPSTHVRVM